MSPLPKLIRAATPEVKLVTVPDVEIVSTGTYELQSPGTHTFTAGDLRDAVRAQDDPAIPAPRLKLGHEFDWGDAEPAFGKVANMRLTNNDQTLVGDLVDVPEWLAKIMGSAWPNRSMEGGNDIESATGKKYSMVIEALSLLGVKMPGVKTLDDLTGMYSEEMPEGVEIGAGSRIAAAVGIAATDIEDVRRAYHASLGEDREQWWVRAIEADPLALIVDDEADHLYRVPVGFEDGKPTFGDPQEVKTAFQPVAASVAKIAASYESRSESRPESTNKEDQVELSPDQLKRLGLPEDATQEQVDAKVEELTAETPPAEGGEGAGSGDGDGDGEPSGDDAGNGDGEGDGEGAEGAEGKREPVAAADGVRQVDKATWDKMVQAAEAGEAARKVQLDRDRDDAIKAAVKAGKIPPSRRDHYSKLWGSDPVGTKQLLDSLEAGAIPVDERGESPSDETIAASESEYPTHWLPEVHGRQGQETGPGTVTQEVN
jgi:hypothetical protein